MSERVLKWPIAIGGVIAAAGWLFGAGSLALEAFGAVEQNNPFPLYGMGVFTIGIMVLVPSVLLLVWRDLWSTPRP